MSYDLFKDYLPAINHTKKNLMDSDDPYVGKEVPCIYGQQSPIWFSRHRNASAMK